MKQFYAPYAPLYPYEYTPIEYMQIWGRIGWSWLCLVVYLHVSSSHAIQLASCNIHVVKMGYEISAVIKFILWETSWEQWSPKLNLRLIYCCGPYAAPGEMSGITLTELSSYLLFGVIRLSPWNTDNRRYKHSKQTKTTNHKDR